MAGAMKLTNSNYPTYLEKTTRDRIVRAALAIENTTPEGGILVIFQMRDSTKLEFRVSVGFLART
jgi:hypothetical protein